MQQRSLGLTMKMVWPDGLKRMLNCKSKKGACSTRENVEQALLIIFNVYFPSAMASCAVTSP